MRRCNEGRSKPLEQTTQRVEIFDSETLSSLKPLNVANINASNQQENQQIRVDENTFPTMLLDQG